MKKFLAVLSVMMMTLIMAVPVFAETEENVSWGTTDILKLVAIAVVIGFVIALIVVSIMKSKLKSIRHKYEAGSYIKPGSFKLNDRNDLYLYNRLEKRAKPKNN